MGRTREIVMSNPAKPQRVCSYCGTSDPETVDHVPPRGLFPRPWPSDLITVPCCSSCHVPWSMHDEHFRNVLVSVSELEQDVGTAKVRDSVIRSLTRSQHARYSAEFIASMTDLDVVTESGVWVGREPALPHGDRIGQVLGRISRGLYFREFGTPFPRTHYIMKPHLDQFDRNQQKLAELGVPLPDMQVACGGQFAFGFALVPDVPASGIWIGKFFGKVSALAFLRERLRGGMEHRK